MLQGNCVWESRFEQRRPLTPALSPNKSVEGEGEIRLMDLRPARGGLCRRAHQEREISNTFNCT